MTAVINPITNADLTTKVVNGTGIFDELMTAATAHLDDQFHKNRITGPQYSEVYLGQFGAVLQQAVLFLIERDKTYLANQLVQLQIELANKDLLLKDKELAQADKQLELLDKQLELAKLNSELTAQKVKTEKAQIQDTVDGVPVAGVIGAQVALYKQQKEGFVRDSEQKAVKVLTDTWITRKTVDDATPLPSGLDTAALDSYLRVLAKGVGANY